MSDLTKEELLSKIRYLEKQIITDELTSLYNRRYLNKRFVTEIYRAKRYNRDLSIMIIDIDNFKNINDSEGHLAGDSLLKTLAHIIKAKIRKSGIAVRFAGDEFVIILPETSKEVTTKIAERIRETVDSLTKTTVSIGVASFPEDGEDHLTLFRNADRCLYKSKENKNEVTNE